MSTNIGPKIGIDGEAAFNRELRQIQEGLKTTRTEMQAVTSAFAANDKSTTALTAQNEVLEKQVYSLNEVLEKQTEHLRELAQAYGEADARTQKMQQEVNRTTAQLNTANRQMEANSKQITYNDSVLGKLGINIDSIGQKLGLSTSATEKLTAAFGSGAAEMAVYGAAAVKVASELNKLSEAAGRHVDQLNTMSLNYGIAVQDLQRLKYMEELTDVSVETVASSMSKLTRAMDSARNGTGNAAEAFSRLHISVTDSNGQLRSSNEIFMETIDALRQVANSTERDALAMDIFGKSAMELNGIIAQGSEGLRELAAEADASGYVMSDKMVSVLQQGDDATQKLDKSWEGLKNTIGAGATPVLAGWKYILAETLDATTNLVQQLAGTKDGFDEVTDSVNAATNALSGLRELTKEDLLSPQQKAYTEYLRQMSSYMASNGIDQARIGGGLVMDYNTFSSKYPNAGGASVNVTVNAQYTASDSQVVRDLSPKLSANATLRGSVL